MVTSRTARAVALVLLVAALALGLLPASPAAGAGPLLGEEQATSPFGFPLKYVALGDSFAAGPLIPLQVEPWGCLKSSNNYANILARRNPVQLTDVTCSGASTKHMTQEHGVEFGPNPPQFDALTWDTAVVTLQIGGNDIGFGGIAEACVEAGVRRESCKEQYVDEQGNDELDRRIKTAAPKVRAAIEGVRARAPFARIYVLGYSAIFKFGPDPSCPAMGVGKDDAIYLRGVQESLNAMIAAQAETVTGARYVDVYGPSEGKTACDLPVIRWVEPVVPAHAAAPVHPNLTGMYGVADVLQVAINEDLARLRALRR